MLLRSPPALHYPITVTELLKRPSELVQRSAPLFRYFFKSVVDEDDELRVTHAVEKTFPTVFESEVEGKLLSWKIQNGSIIPGPSTELAEIDEFCTHDVQYGGMCVNCGKDLTETDYNTTVPDTRRADTGIAHVNNALKISKQEAARIDEEAKQRLLGNRKLSLVVDLDLTVIHASVDPTIGEWQNDENNPNHEALKDVKTFELFDDAMRRQVSYYIKLRPGLARFLENISKMYEMHIYTMATRSYADNVARIIDPDEKLFGDRILSRSDTPGEEHRKNIHKLFPVDNRMVVIIDDRADVWAWSKYLLRVKPFNFFIGIGDINSSFLPKQEDYTATKSNQPATEENGTQDDQTNDRSSPNNDRISNGAKNGETDESQVTDASAREESTLDQLVSMQDNSDSATIQQKTAEQDEALAAQMNERPLLQQQKLLEEFNDARANGEEGVDDADENTPPKPRQNLLQNDDDELTRIEESLTRIHEAFFNAYDEAKAVSKASDSTSGEASNRKKPTVHRHRLESARLNSMLPDVKDVMNPYRTETLRGCRLAFSKIIPLDEDPWTHPFVRMACRLGAEVDLDLTSSTTHVVARRGDATVKMRQAASDPRIKIVASEWLWESSAHWWKRINETPFLIEVVNPSRPSEGATVGPESGKAVIDVYEDEDDPALRLDTVNTGVNGEASSPVTPIDEYNDEDWADIQNQIDEMDSESDDDDQGSDGYDSSETEGAPESDQVVSPRKRKRAPESDAGSLDGDFPHRRKRNAVDERNGKTEDGGVRPEFETNLDSVMQGQGRSGDQEPRDEVVDDFEAAMAEAIRVDAGEYDDDEVPSQEDHGDRRDED